MANAQSCSDLVPYSSSYTMEEFFAWQQGADYNDPFCIANVPLAPRFTNTDTSCDAAAGQYPGLMACFDYPGGGSPQQVQGTTDFNIYNFYFWQYLDVFIYFNGDEQQGQIIRPPVFWVNAGHRNGVPVLGNLFFQGQDTSKLQQLVALDKTTGRYPGGDLLIAIAAYYGFDGWFLNPEVDGGTPALAQNISDFLIYIEQKKFPGFQMVYYDSMISDGSLGYQGQLDKYNQMFFQTASGQRASDMFFADYRWADGIGSPQTSSANALAYKRCPFEVYSAIDLQGQEYQVNSLLQQIKPDNQNPYTSIGFYGTPFTYYSGAPYTQPVYAAREIEFWLGPTGNSNAPPVPSDWKGVAYYISPRSVIASYPFVTRFNTGQGQEFYVNGAQAQGASGPFGSWNNISQEDILPTFQYWQQNVALTVSFSYDMAFDGGSSLLFQGSVNGSLQNQYQLFSTQLLVSSGVSIGLKFNVPNGAGPFLSIALVFADSAPVYYAIEGPISSGWNTAEFDLSALSGKTIIEIGLLIAPPQGTPSTAYQLYVGEFYVLNAPVSTPATPVPTITQSIINGQTACVNVSWPAPTQPIWYWNLFDLTSPSQPVFLGRSFAQVFNVANLAYPASGSASTLGVQGVALDGGTSDYGNVAFDWTASS